MSVHNFLERVAELCVARHLSERQLFDSAVDLFSEKALSWFRANKGRFNDWQTFTVLLRRHFDPPVRDLTITKSIWQPRQHRDVKVAPRVQVQVRAYVT